ncbi:MAG TPA: hypothetical protein VG165_07540 [Solirubrobacteraceae bacterium]|jgi:hypothetical protein|nr:hypothetical protein [Solirubrobacteraceae bacterium]
MSPTRPPTGEAPGRRPVEDAAYRPAAAPLAFWAILLGALAALQAGFGGKSLPVLVQAGAAGLIGLIALALAAGPRILRRRAGGLRLIPDLSLATPLAAISLAAMLAGATVGTWLILGGFLGLLVGIGGVVREHRAQRRARRAGSPRATGGERPESAEP